MKTFIHVDDCMKTMITQCYDKDIRLLFDTGPPLGMFKFVDVFPLYGSSLDRRLDGAGICEGLAGRPNVGEDNTSSVGVELELVPADGILNAGDTGSGIIEALFRFLHRFLHETNTIVKLCFLSKASTFLMAFCLVKALCHFCQACISWLSFLCKR